jgi:HK97 gp10 family phage protein
MAVRVQVDERAIADLLSDPQVVAAIGEVADRAAGVIAARAPRRTGRGAASIHAEPDQDLPGAFRVSWDRDHFYMSFQNDGTGHQRARHFVEDALSQFR